MIDRLIGCLIRWWLNRLRVDLSNPFVSGESASPFIDEGDGLTSERERESVCMLSLVAHAVGYKMIVGAHNTVDVTIECQMHVGGLCCLLWVW